MRTREQIRETGDRKAADARSRSLLPNPCSLLPGRNRRHAGFALLIVITLLAFIVLLLVGLAAYTRVETAVAGNTQRQAQARENALFALNVAVGQLQKYAGPDQRVTATAEAFANDTGTSRYTGVWPSDATTTETPATPLTWLVSGNEGLDADGVSQPLAVTPSNEGSSVVDLVGSNTTGARSRNQNYVIAPLQTISVAGVPGARPGVKVPIGRYAWWVGDQGVKAPVAVSDKTASVDYAPYDSDDLRSRLRQQIALGAGATDASGNPVFEPLGTDNIALVAKDKVMAFSQLPLLKWSTVTSANSRVSTARGYFHTWSPNNFSVLANTKLGGLRQDLSLDPGLLGSGFAAWANYKSYMEPPVPAAPADPDNPAPAGPPVISPDYGSDPVRRRYRITPPVQGEGVIHQVAPVLSACLLNFNLQTASSAEGPQPLQARVQAIVGLWNPYSSALVPPAPGDNLRIEVTGLPPAAEFVDANGTTLAVVPLADILGPKFSLELPWESNNPELPTLASNRDFASWLPGRVYYWTSATNTGGSNTSIFYWKNFVGQPGSGFVERPDTSGAVVDSTTEGQWIVRSRTTLTIQLFRGSEPNPIGTYTSPEFVEFLQNDPVKASSAAPQFGFYLRLSQNKPDPKTDTWLVSAGRDPRGPALALEAPNGESPVPAPTQIKNEDLLLERVMGSTGHSYNEDVPVFELPRAPILSLGVLQHLLLPEQRPFAIGNPWGAAAQLNNIPAGELFDRFFFSGATSDLTPSTTTAGDLILPNPLLKPLRNRDGTKPSVDDFRATADLLSDKFAQSRSSKYLLQAGAFNVNSTNANAWAAVLRSVRFPDPQAFSYLNLSASTGTVPGDGSKLTVQSDDAQFFRFSQSAQETYKAEAGQAEANADPPSPANTDLFRKGMRSLSAEQVDALATKIAALVKQKLGDTTENGGPFRSLEEFLKPSPLYGTLPPPPNEGEDPLPPGPPRSLLEAAIADTGINVDAGGNVMEFSSQFLTQADIMTALAPVLFARSDTFVIRAYGEAINPAKAGTGATVPANAVEGRAWCEAIVQRMPEYFDPSMPAEATGTAFDPVANPDNPDAEPTLTPAQQVNKALGRRFRIVSFRWLTRSDI